MGQSVSVILFLNTIKLEDQEMLVNIDVSSFVSKLFSEEFKVAKECWKAKTVEEIHMQQNTFIISWASVKSSFLGRFFDAKYCLSGKLLLNYQH